MSFDAGRVADDLLDDVLPEELDWRGKVRAYPLPALVLAAAGGFILGAQRGRRLVATATAFAMGELARNVERVLSEPRRHAENDD